MRLSAARRGVLGWLRRSEKATEQPLPPAQQEKRRRAAPERLLDPLRNAIPAWNDEKACAAAASLFSQLGIVEQILAQMANPITRPREEFNIPAQILANQKFIMESVLLILDQVTYLSSGHEILSPREGGSKIQPVKSLVQVERNNGSR